MKYAVAKIGSRQYKLTEGGTIKFDGFKGSVDEVLLYVDGETVKIGQPLVEGVNVKTTVLGEDKIKTDIRRFKAKTGYRRRKGHKQPISIVRIEKISLGKE